MFKIGSHRTLVLLSFDVSIDLSSRYFVIEFCPWSTISDVFPFSFEVLLAAILVVDDRFDVGFDVVVFPFVVVFLLLVVVLCCLSCCSFCSIASLSNKFFLRPIPSSFPFTSVLGGGCCCCSLGLGVGGVVVGISGCWLFMLLVTVGFGRRLGSVGGWVGVWIS